MTSSAAAASSNAEKKVSIVVVNYNAGDLLRLCVKNSLPQATELIVVDNASADGSLDKMLDEFAGVAKLQIIRNAKNLGFAAACNLGANLSKGDFVLFLNPDCIAAEGAVQHLAYALDADPNAGMAGGLLLNPDGLEQVGCRRAVPTPWRSMVRALHLSVFKDRWPRLFSDFNLQKQPLPTEPIVMEAISGACTMVKRDAMKDVGPWDEVYFMHCEDLDLCMRYRKKLWTIIFVPDGRFVHFRGACSRTRPLFVEWNKHRGMMIFYRKHFKHQYPLGLMLLVWFGVCLRFVGVALLIFFRK